MPEAMSLGLINKIAPRDELDTQAMKWAEELAEKSPVAVQIAKTAFYQSEDMHYQDQFAHMNEAFARLCTTHDAKEGVTAFFRKTGTCLAGKISQAQLVLSSSILWLFSGNDLFIDPSIFFLQRWGHY
jgi:hypothetical protein